MVVPAAREIVPMRRNQFGLKALLWLTLAVATVLTSWAMIDLAAAACGTGEVPYMTLVWMGAAYSMAVVTLVATRAKI